MAGKNFSVNTKDFDLHFGQVTKKIIPTLIQKGLFNAANEALRDANFEKPFTPWKIGDLEGSKEVHPPKSLKDLFIEFGFNIVYAARLHEDGLPTWNWSREGSGPKFLTTKLVRHKDKYMKIVAVTIEKGQGTVI